MYYAVCITWIWGWMCVILTKIMSVQNNFNAPKTFELFDYFMFLFYLFIFWVQKRSRKSHIQHQTEKEVYL